MDKNRKHVKRFSILGNYRKCNLVTIKSAAGNEYTCNYVCDVKTTGTTEIKIRSSTFASQNPAICDMKVL